MKISKWQYAIRCGDVAIISRSMLEGTPNCPPVYVFRKGGDHGALAALGSFNRCRMTASWRLRRSQLITQTGWSDVLTTRMIAAYTRLGKPSQAHPALHRADAVLLFRCMIRSLLIIYREPPGTVAGSDQASDRTRYRPLLTLAEASRNRTTQFGDCEVPVIAVFRRGSGQAAGGHLRNCICLCGVGAQSRTL